MKGIKVIDNRLHDFHKGLISGNIYSRLPLKNEEALAMISLYRHGSPWAKLEAKRWLQNVIESLGKWRWKTKLSCGNKKSAPRKDTFGKTN